MKQIHIAWGAERLEICSTDDGIDPDVVLVGLAADLMFEVIAAAAYLRHLTPAMKVRVVNVTDPMVLGLSDSHPHSLSHAGFDALFSG
jgi:xylulose-5-phosphate/fructose-6-phosphate phosphoketolase